MNHSHMTAEDVLYLHQHCVKLNVFSLKLVPEPFRGVHEVKSKIVVDAVTTITCGKRGGLGGNCLGLAPLFSTLVESDLFTPYLLPFTLSLPL